MVYIVEHYHQDQKAHGTSSRVIEERAEPDDTDGVVSVEADGLGEPRKDTSRNGWSREGQGEKQITV